MGGKVETIDEEIDPVVMDVKDILLSFDAPIKVSGKAYLAEDFLVMNLNISTEYNVPCKICQETIVKTLELEHVYFTEELTNVSSKVFDAVEQIRDTIFMDIPDYHECEGGCPMREELKGYFQSSKTEPPVE